MTAFSYKRQTAACKKIYIYEFNNCDNLFFCIERLYKNFINNPFKNDLYSINKKYRLVIFATAGHTKITEIINELSDRTYHSIIDLAYTREYGKLITKNNAAQKMGKALIKDF